MDASRVVADFNAMQGRLRVSVTHACQLRCRFCHREGIADHWTSVIMTPQLFSSLVQAYTSIGGCYLEVTGGEPTLHPSLGTMLSVAADAGCRVVLCTNGLRLDRIAAEIHTRRIHLVRLSLHFGGDSPEQARRLLGPAWDFERVARNVAELRASEVPVQLIFTHTRENHDQLEPVLRCAYQWGVDVQVIDVIPSRAGDPGTALGYMTGDDSERVVARHATLERVITDRTGAVLRLYRTPLGATWEVKDYHFGVLHSAMCNGCHLRAQCGEGIYALRVDALGIAKPCLLREDLEFKLKVDGSITSLANTLLQTIAMMLSHPRKWSYEGVLPA